MMMEVADSVGAERSLLTPDAIMWRVNREAVLLLGGARAILMQIAHPLVAAGVADHSDFLKDPIGRFRGTLQAALAIGFGTERQAEATWQRIDAIHGRVTGTLRHSAGSYSAATPYAARDPDLLMWVHATLIDSSMVAYERFVRKLSGAERAQFYRESKTMAGLFGIPANLIPADLAEFELYMREMIENRLELSHEARVLAHKVLYPLGYVPHALFDAFNLLTAGLLPPRLREMYGFEWGPGREMLLDGSARAIQMLLQLTPAFVRVWPAARGAERNLSAAAPH